jgi:hypothetical protein
MERPGGQMEWTLLERILDQLAAGRVADLLLFHQQGEPTLYARLPDAVRAASDRGLKPCVTTNGSTLHDRLVDALLESRLHRLTISLQTPDPKSYAIRGARNLSFSAFEERVVRAVRRVLAARGAATEVNVVLLTNPLGRIALPTIGRDWSIVSTTEGLHAVLRDWAARCLEGAPDAPPSDAVARAIERARAARANTLRLGARLIFETRQVGEWPAPATAAPGAWFDAPFGTCHGLTDHFAILWDGRYSYCCVDYEGRTSHARVQDLPVLDYLASRPVQRAIRGFARMAPVHPYCKKCLGGPSRAIALGKAVGSIAYFGLYRPHLGRVAAADPSPAPAEAR